MNVREHPLYSTWLSIYSRCHNPRHKGFSRYGSRGIHMYPLWRENKQAFFDYIGNKPSPSHSIDRIDNSKGYEPGNIRWATPFEQTANRVAGDYTRSITVNGRTQFLSEWAREVGVSTQVISLRLKRGWPVERAVWPTLETAMARLEEAERENASLRELLQGRR